MRYNITTMTRISPILHSSYDGILIIVIIVDLPSALQPETALQLYTNYLRAYLFF